MKSSADSCSYSRVFVSIQTYSLQIMHSFRATILPGPSLLTPPFVSGAQQGLKNGLGSRTIAETFSGNPSVSITERLWAFQHQWQGRGVYVGSFDESVNANLSRYCGCQ